MFLFICRRHAARGRHIYILGRQFDRLRGKLTQFMGGRAHSCPAVAPLMWFSFMGQSCSCLQIDF